VPRTTAPPPSGTVTIISLQQGGDWLWYSPFYVEISRRFADDCRTEKDFGGVDSGQDDPPEDRTAVADLCACRGGEIQ